MTTEELDRINRAEEIQRYTENRCEALEKENAELKKACNETQELLDKQIEATYKVVEKLTEAKLIIKLLLWDLRNRDYKPVKDIEQAEQFLNEHEINEERLCTNCDQYKSCPDGKRCRISDNGSKWKRQTK